MFAFGKFPRSALIAAGVLFTLQVLAIAIVQTPETRLLLSDLLELAIIACASVSAFTMGRRSDRALRRLWFLLGSSLALASMAQALSSYYQHVPSPPSTAPWPSDILFFIWVAPAALMFRSTAAEKRRRVSWQEVLGYSQVAIVALTAFLFFIQLPSRWLANGPNMQQRMLELFVARDVLFAAGFLIRAKTLHSPPFKAFYERMTVFFLAAGLAEVTYLLWPGGLSGHGVWKEIVWSLPSLFVVSVVATWRNPEAAVTEEFSPSPSGSLVSHLLTVCIPLLVLMMGLRTAKERPTVAWTIIALSFACSFAQLISTNELQRRTANDLRKAQQAWHRSERMFETLFHSSPDAITVSALPGGEFLELNEGFVQLSGYSREETLGRTSQEMRLWEDVEQRSQVMARFQEHGEIRDEEFRLRRKSGEIRTGRYSGAIIHLEGRPYALIVVRDVTARRAAEEALQASEEQFRTLVENMHVGVAAIGANLEFQFLNQSGRKMFQIEGDVADQTIGRDIRELDLVLLREDGTEIPFSMRPVSRVIETQSPIHNQAVGWRVRGRKEVIWTILDATPQFTPDGKLLRIIISLTDITGRKRSEEALHQLSTRLLQLQDEERRHLGWELHDGLAQSVLAVNLNLAQLTQARVPLDDGSRHALGEARRLLQEMSREIRTLSYLLHPPLLDELGLVSALREYTEGFSQRSGIGVETDLAEAIGRLKEDAETALFRIVQESLSNIQRHSGSSWARVCLQEQPGWITLEVGDHGHGISQTEDTQEGRTGTRFGVGILGMSERMKQLGGRLVIESGAMGTIVRASIPVKYEVVYAAANPSGG